MMGVGAVGAACGACASAAPLPARAIELNAAGARAVAEGNLPLAEARLSVALEYSPRFVEAWVNLGYVELGRGNFEQARRDFVEARDLNQDIPTPHHALGVLADRQGRGDEAEDHYRAALKVDPGFAPARANLARRLFERGRFDEAREQFARLVEVAPDTLDGWVGEAETLRRLGREGDAEALVDRARDRFGDAPGLRLLLARAQVERGEWREAEALLAPLVGGTDRARAGAAWSWIAIARLGRGDTGGANAAVREALTIDRDDAVARYALGLLSR
ncbi:MAG TPA: tetratricopeptide repeat protein [Polyangiaceae bacterium]|jgi:Flp pilus assembly protein TadD|nr:tetratricopeptide repeat protein [Polyangiaceae bacterium]